MSGELKYVIRLATSTVYLKSFDPDFQPGVDHPQYHPHKTGLAQFTPDIRRAMTFPTFEAAMEFWKTQSRVMPIRPDGKPNRPLTAYTVTVEAY